MSASNPDSRTSRRRLRAGLIEGDRRSRGDRMSQFVSFQQPGDGKASANRLVFLNLAYISHAEYEQEKGTLSLVTGTGGNEREYRLTGQAAQEVLRVLRG